MYDTMTFKGNADSKGNDVLIIKGNNFHYNQEPNKLFGIKLLDNVIEVNHEGGFIITTNGEVILCEEAKGPKILGKIDLPNDPIKRIPTIKDVTVIERYNGGRFHFFSVPFAISSDQARKLQGRLGYHPAGYGFYGFDATISQTVWKCQDSCD